ncbi:MAG TPA: hypothetical protein VKE40_23625 [Gemmataceae bacterium]|nr:hypothetical protein [Gemmataceae bacterium]
MSETVIVLVLLAVWLLMCAMVGRAASSFHRPPGTWFLLAAVLSPLAAYVLLLLAGDPEAWRALAEREDRIRRRHPNLKNVREAVLNEAHCPRCGAEVNPVTGEGLHCPEEEPWLLICDGCQTTYQPD